MKKIKLFSPDFDQTEIDAVKKTINSGNWASGSGTGNVKKFENNFKKYTGANDCVAVDSGTAALHLAISLSDIKNKEVLVPSLTFISTINAIKYNGGKPIFVDVDPITLNIDTEDIKEKISEKSAMILPVYFGGLTNGISKIKKIAKQKQLQVISDAAHACGSKINQKKIGSEFEYVCFSFHPVKNLAMPKGGAITINKSNFKPIRKKLNSLRWCGIDNRKNSLYDITNLGYNYYMDEISATIGNIQLKKLEKMNRYKFYLAKQYFEELKTPQKMPITKDCSYHLYWIRVKNRKKFRKEMQNKGIETGTHYQPAHLMSIFKKKSKLPITEEIAKEIVTLPIHSNIKKNDVEYIIKSVNSLL